MRLTLVPAYGRDYKSKAAVIADWEADKDFEAVGITGSGYINRAQAIGDKITEVTIRYKRLTQLVIVKVSK
jgi:hypothetical protein